MAEHQPIEKRRERLLIQLTAMQRRDGHISQAMMQKTAAKTDLSLSDIYGVTSFYSFLSTWPLGRHTVRICRSVPCFLKDADSLATMLEREIGISPGETTTDGRFSLEMVNCIGACDQAPAMLVDDDTHGNLTPARIRKILKNYP